MNNNLSGSFSRKAIHKRNKPTPVWLIVPQVHNKKEHDLWKKKKVLSQQPNASLIDILRNTKKNKNK